MSGPFLVYTGRRGIWPLKRLRPGARVGGRTSPAPLTSEAAEAGDSPSNRQNQTGRLGNRGGEPDALVSKKKGHDRKACRQQHQAPADGDGESGERALHGSEKPGKDHVKSHDQKRPGVHPQGGHGIIKDCAVPREEGGHHRWAREGLVEKKGFSFQVNGCIIREIIPGSGLGKYRRKPC